MLAQFISENLYNWFLVFIRIGAAVYMFPGLGDRLVNSKIRMFLALAISITITPVVRDKLPAFPSDVLMLSLYVCGEALIGLYIGLIVRMLITALDMAGMIIAFQTGFSNASVMNPSLSFQSSLPGVYLGVIGITLIFIMDVHHGFFRALVDSYEIFKPFAVVPFADLSSSVSHMVADSFQIGVRIAAPFLIVGLLFFVSIGFLSRLMPQLQIFFVMMPVQLLLGLILLVMTVSVILMFWMNMIDSRLMTYIQLVR